MPAKTPPFRVAIIGTGGIAHAHARALAELGDRAVLVGVADVDRSRAEGFATEFGASGVYTDAADLLAAETGLDLVHICTPPQTHAALAIQAMRAGVPALVEKPTVLSLAEMDELVRVNAEPQHRAEILRTADIFRARVVDVTPVSFVLEATGDDGKLEALIELLRPIGIQEVVRTGKIAITRGPKTRMKRAPSSRPRVSEDPRVVGFAD